MTPEQFIDKWRGITRTERSAAQEHFLDVCALLSVPKPADVDRHGTEYTFEKSTRKIGDSSGFADVWKRHCFAWEYKGNRRNLVEAYAQLKQYADALENPPLLIVSDMQEIRVHTNFTNAIAQQYVIPLMDLRSVEARDLLRNCFLHPDRLLPTQTHESVTADWQRRRRDNSRVARYGGLFSGGAVAAALGRMRDATLVVVPAQFDGDAGEARFYQRAVGHHLQKERPL